MHPSYTTFIHWTANILPYKTIDGASIICIPMLVCSQSVCQFCPFVDVQIYMSPLTTPSVDDNLNSSHQSVVPVEHLEPLSPSVNKVCDFATTKTNRVQLILHLCMRMLSFKTQTHTYFIKNTISPSHKASSNPYEHLHLGR